jgi:hypothetical protein
MCAKIKHEGTKHFGASLTVIFQTFIRTVSAQMLATLLEIPRGLLKSPKLNAEISPPTGQPHIPKSLLIHNPPFSHSIQHITASAAETAFPSRKRVYCGDQEMHNSVPTKITV